jgi:hypothetical protein
MPDLSMAGGYCLHPFWKHRQCIRGCTTKSISSYLANQLLRFRAGDRASASEMTSIAKQLDREQIHAAAAFLASQ